MKTSKLKPDKLKHTPAPWTAHPRAFSPVSGLRRWDLLSEQGAICQFYTGNEANMNGAGSTEANARLCAAAPDLKHALELHIAFLEDLRKSNPRWVDGLVVDFGLLNEAYLASSAAIVKATP